MQITLKEILKTLSLPLTLIFIYLIFLAGKEIFKIPTVDEIIDLTSMFFQEYGLLVVFIAGLLEGMLIAGNYFPGGVIVFLGVISATGDISRSIIVVLTISISFFIAYIFNYFIGRQGWYHLLKKLGYEEMLERMKEKLSKHIFIAVLSSYWVPNLAAITSTSAGIIRIPFKKFLSASALGIIVWNTFWGIFAYITGDALFKMDFLNILFLFILWCGIILGKVFIYDKKFKSKTDSNIIGNSN
ncbi:MAG: VTT domain-containing protein [Candidatus Paceibacterota bacterium]|jgi:membrane protein DedA with SNARE-associated domain